MNICSKLKGIDKFFEDLSIEEFDYILEKALNEASDETLKDVNRKLQKRDRFILYIDGQRYGVGLD